MSFVPTAIWGVMGQARLKLRFKAWLSQPVIALFVGYRRQRPAQRLMTISIPPGVADATKLLLTADIKAAIGKIREDRKIALAVRSRSMVSRKLYAT